MTVYKAIERLKYRIVCEALELLENNLKISNMDELQRDNVLYSCSDIKRRIDNVRNKYKSSIEKGEK